MADHDPYRKVLFIAYYFPPMGLSGVQRTVKFAKYLPQYGWKPTVLTVAPTGYYAFDNTLLAEIESAGVEIVRTSSLDANRMFAASKPVKMPSERVRRLLQFGGDFIFIPDTKIGWKSRAVRAGKELLARERYDLIFATAPPQTDFLIGCELKRSTGIPLVVDYRDAWLDYPFKYFPTPFHRYWHRRLERRVLKAADRVLVTHRRVKEQILRRNHTMTYHDVVILSQGFDAEDFVDVSLPKPPAPGRMRITHSGTFYADRSPAVILHALTNLVAAHPRLRGRIELNLVGTIREEDRLLVQKLNIQDMVAFQGYLPHREAVAHLVASDLLWFVIDNDYQTPGKLYEYFGARKPILASVVDGYTRQLIEEYEGTACVELNDVAAHERALLTLFDAFEHRRLPRVNGEAARRYDRFALTGELAKQFESLMDFDRQSVVQAQEGDSR
ncbi:MAG: glycosyltransferase family 4 protein [Bacteroidetes bacterium]|jgi:glycosyltransferase involved in cell wall biosynthesis|nr:glycosyltransferase family 4 protein [Bacteroidota bacterium]